MMISGLILYYINDQLIEAISKACPEEDGRLVCTPLIVGFVDFGLKGIALSLLIVSVVLIVLYDWCADVFVKIWEIISSHPAVNLELTKQAISSGSLIHKEKIDLIHQLFKYIHKEPDKYSESLAKDLTYKYAELRLKAGGFWRESQSVNVRLDEFEVGDPLKDDYLMWKETCDYDVRGTKPGKHMFHAFTGVDYKVDNPTSLIEFWRYSVKYNNREIFNIEDKKDQIIGYFSQGTEFEFSQILKESDRYVGKLIITSRKGHIYATVEYKIPISISDLESETSHISIIEHLPIENKGDMSIYHLIEPTRGFTKTFSVPVGYEISGFFHPLGKIYTTDHESGGDQEDPRAKSYMNEGAWHLPGMVCAAQWRKLN